MTTLFVLIAIQIAGIVICLGVSCIIYFANKRKTFISGTKKNSLAYADDSWPWLIDYFQEFPGSRLKHQFPHLYRIAKATKRYKEINQLKVNGAISEKKYDRELKKILPLIDIKSDLHTFSHRKSFE